MPDATFACPDLTTFCRLDELGLEVVGQRLEPDRAVLSCRLSSRTAGAAAADAYWPHWSWSTLVVLRAGWVFIGAALARRRSRRRGEPLPQGWRESAVVSWAGMRGVVTVAATLALPEVVDGAGPSRTGTRS